MLIVYAHDLLDRIGSLDSVVVWDDRGVVMEDMGGDNVVEEVLLDEANISIDRTSSSANESPHLGIVVRKTTVGVVQISNSHCT